MPSTDLFGACVVECGFQMCRPSPPPGGEGAEVLKESSGPRDSCVADLPLCPPWCSRRCRLAMLAVLEALAGWWSLPGPGRQLRGRLGPAEVWVEGQVHPGCGCSPAVSRRNVDPECRSQGLEGLRGPAPCLHPPRHDVTGGVGPRDFRISGGSGPRVTGPFLKPFFGVRAPHRRRWRARLSHFADGKTEAGEDEGW